MRRHSRKLAAELLEPRTMLANAVVPSAETVSVGSADDIAIWIHPTDTARSTVIGTAKSSSNSLRVFDLQGQEIQRVSVPNVNNVDLRYNFKLDGQATTILAGSNRASDSIVLYEVDSQSGTLSNVAARTISTGLDIYGLAMYVSADTGDYYVFVSSESGQLQQWRLQDNGTGRVDAELVRSFSVGSIVEGLVADDVLGHLYVGEENVGIWKYAAEPDGGTNRTRVDSTGSGGNLDADVEGLTLYYTPDGKGYLIASSQGDDEFAIYRREGNNQYIGRFDLVAGAGIDAVSDTDGIDVTNVALGNRFPLGMFVAQDNDANFKFVRWDAIDAAFSGSLTTDTSWDPRQVGADDPPDALPGDYDKSGKVDAADYTLWRDMLGSSVPTEGAGADGNRNGIVDVADYEVWKANYNQTNPATAGAFIVPASDEFGSSTSERSPNAMSRAGVTSEEAVDPDIRAHAIDYLLQTNLLLLSDRDAAPQSESPEDNDPWQEEVPTESLDSETEKIEFTLP